MSQSNEHVANGVSIDDDRTQTDLLGGSVVWLAPSLPRGIDVIARLAARGGMGHNMNL